MRKNSWVKVFKTIPEFRIFRFKGQSQIMFFSCKCTVGVQLQTMQVHRSRDGERVIGLGTWCHVSTRSPIKY